MKHAALFVKIFIFALFISVVVRYVALQPYIVSDNAMAPEFHKGDVLLINRFAEPLRNTVIVFKDTKTLERSLRRVIALPGERIAVNDGIISIENKDGDTTITELPLFGTVMLTLPGVGKIDAHEVFVMPDHAIQDFYGLIDTRHIIGTPIARIYPFSRIVFFNN
ncbi:MAG: signal peptidase I [Candidatus Ryanbacteria bacterium]|nr:signal peptidase I [Candidatus Ryanbacteria bacterium]